MSWNQQDNKHYRGPIDRIYVSPTEHYEVEYFINEYLRTRNYEMTEQNRHAVGEAMQGYPGHAPVARSALEDYLDRRFGRK